MYLAKFILKTCWDKCACAGMFKKEFKKTAWNKIACQLELHIKEFTPTVLIRHLHHLHMQNEYVNYYVDMKSCIWSSISFFFFFWWKHFSTLQEDTSFHWWTCMVMDSQEPMSARFLTLFSESRTDNLLCCFSGEAYAQHKNQNIISWPGKHKVFIDHMALWGLDCFAFECVYYYTACHTIN